MQLKKLDFVMNVAITKAAEGFPRRAFTVDDISRMMEAGVIGEDENFELIEGDLVVMAAKHVGHDGIKNELSMALARSAPDGMLVGIECSLRVRSTRRSGRPLHVLARRTCLS